MQHITDKGGWGGVDIQGEIEALSCCLMWCWPTCIFFVCCPRSWHSFSCLGPHSSSHLSNLFLLLIFNTMSPGQGTLANQFTQFDPFNVVVSARVMFLFPLGTTHWDKKIPAIRPTCTALLSHMKILTTKHVQCN